MLGNNNVHNQYFGMFKQIQSHSKKTFTFKWLTFLKILNIDINTYKQHRILRISKTHSMRMLMSFAPQTRSQLKSVFSTKTAVWSPDSMARAAATYHSWKQRTAEPANGAVFRIWNQGDLCILDHLKLHRGSGAYRTSLSIMCLCNVGVVLH